MAPIRSLQAGRRASRRVLLRHRAALRAASPSHFAVARSRPVAPTASCILGARGRRPSRCHGFGRDSFAVWLDPDRGLRRRTLRTRETFEGKQKGPLRGIIVGGLNAPQCGLRELLHGRFAGYHVADERIRLGFHPDNPVNLPSAHGVQVELPPGLRGIGDFEARPCFPDRDGDRCVRWWPRLSGVGNTSCEGSRARRPSLPDGSAPQTGYLREPFIVGERRYVSECVPA